MTIKVDLLPSEKRGFGLDPVLIVLLIIVVLCVVVFYFYQRLARQRHCSQERRSEEMGRQDYGHQGGHPQDYQDSRRQQPSAHANRGHQESVQRPRALRERFV